MRGGGAEHRGDGSLAPLVGPCDEASSARSTDFPPLGLLVFVVGSASLGAEIAAARLMAPFFGASTIVWANTIGVVLVSLSVGYWFGGRFADRHPHKQGLCALVLLAALAVAADPVRRRPVPRRLGGRARRGLGGGLHRLAGRRHGAGRAAGDAARRRLAVCDPARGRADRGERHRRRAHVRDLDARAAWSGTFASALLLIPLVGTRRTFLVFGLACALVARDRRRAGAPRSRCPAAIVALLALPVGHDQGDERRRRAGGGGDRVPVRARRRGARRRAQARVERGPGRPLPVPAGLLPDRRLLGRVPRAARSPPRAEPPREGRDPRQRRGHDGARARPLLPAHRGRRGRDRLRADAGSGAAGSTCATRGCGVSTRTRARTCGAPTARYDAIIVDAYRQPYIPFYLATREFFELARERLQPGRSGDRERGPSRRARTTSRRCSARRWRESSRPCCAIRARTRTRMILASRGRRIGGAAAARGPRLPPSCGRWRSRPRPGSRPRLRGRRRLHRRQGAGRVADRQVDRRLCGGRRSERATEGAFMNGDGRRRFEGRVVVVTGGGSGLGEAMSKAFAARGRARGGARHPRGGRAEGGRGGRRRGARLRVRRGGLRDGAGAVRARSPAISATSRCWSTTPASRAATRRPRSGCSSRCRRR